MENQKQLITEIMNDDAKDGLYKQQTAVEWLLRNIPNLGQYIPLGVSLELHAKFQQAKQMEREQIEEAYKAGDTFPAFYNDASDYYTQTYRQ